jgi:hypothetical protein
MLASEPACVPQPVCLQGGMTEQPPAAVTEDLDRLRAASAAVIPAPTASNLLGPRIHQSGTGTPRGDERFVDHCPLWCEFLLA